MGCICTKHTNNFNANFKGRGIVLFRCTIKLGYYMLNLCKQRICAKVLGKEKSQQLILFSKYP